MVGSVPTTSFAWNPGEGDKGAEEVIQSAEGNGGETTNHLFTRLDLLRSKLRGVGLIILLIMGAVAGVMASFGKTQTAMSVLMGAVIFFALSWVISLIQGAMQ